MDDRPIGIFDSGVGGLTVAAQLMKQLPNENLVYFGDTARLPYGSKSRETVTRFSLQNVRFLLTQNVKAVVVACNTASSNSREAMQAAFDLPIFGVVEPGAAEAVRQTQNKQVGVIGTAATIRSGAYDALIQRLDPEVTVHSCACPLFVPLAEEGWTDNQVTELTIRAYLTPLAQEGIDALVLGCTHYPLLKKCLARVLGPGIALVDPAREAARQVQRYLGAHGLLRENPAAPAHHFFVSDISSSFAALSGIALHHTFVPQKIDIERY